MGGEPDAEGGRPGAVGHGARECGEGAQIPPELPAVFGLSGTGRLSHHFCDRRSGSPGHLRLRRAGRCGRAADMVSDRPFPMLGRPLHDGRKVKLMRVGLSACRRERARSLHNGMEARVDIPVEALVKTFTSHTRLLRDLPHTLRFGHIADYGLPQRRIVKLGHR